MRYLLLLSLLACCGCAARSMPRQDLYVYSDSDILRYLRAHGFSGDDFAIVGKSCDGARIVVRELRGGDGAFWAMDSAEERPRRLNWPSHRQVWLDGSGEIGAWADSLGEDGLHLSNGRTKRIAPGAYIKFKVSQYADFFYVQDREKGSTEVYRSSEPEKPAFVVQSSWDEFPDDIYTCGDAVYLVSYGNLSKRNCTVFRSGPDGYVRVRQTRIPGWIRDIDPRTGLLLISTSWDWPLTGFMYLFDEKSGQKTSVGYSLNTVETFLAQDFLGDRLARR